MADKKKVALNKPFRLPAGSSKKFGVYVKNASGNVVKVTFGDPNMEIRRDNPDARKNFRARHNCSSPGPKWKARYWSCWQWRGSSPVKGEEVEYVEMSLFDMMAAPVIEESCCDDCEQAEAAKKKPGLWENIRRKKERMGKNYRPAKPGDPDRPTKEALEKSQSELDEFTKREVFVGKDKKKKQEESKAEDLSILAEYNSYNQPQKPTDGGDDKKKKKKKGL